MIKNSIGPAALCALLLLGCGLKANPVAPASGAARGGTVQKPSVAAEGGAAVLSWRLSSSDRVSYTIIERSTLGSAGNICRDCPRTFEPIDRLPADNAGEKSREYRFVDSSVGKGKTYSYRLQLCEETGVCRESQTVEIDFK
ncbi:MAG TPA: hypothetical protein PKO04_09865 [Smithellaceae bacterium]|nr:hypothetical protein [Smithellaceae bacterium]